MAKDRKFFSKSLLISIALHAIFFAFLFTSLSFTATKTPLTVNLQRDPQPDGVNIVKAKVIDKRAVDQELQRQLAAERLAQQQQAEQQAKHQELEREREQKLQAEFAAKQAAESKLKLEQEKFAKQQQAQQLKAKQEAEKKKAKQAEEALAAKQAAAKELAVKQAAAKAAAAKEAAAKAAAAKHAAAIKAQQDILAAEHAEFLLTEVEKYRAAIQAAIEDNRILSSVFAGDISCKIRIKLLPDGSILSAAVVESSGNPAYDEMSTKAVYKSAPFPMPQDQEVYNQLRDVVLSFKNGDQSADVF